MRMARNIAGIGVLGGLCLVAACGDPVPPAALAGISIHIQEYDPMDPVHGMDRCPPSRHWINVPYDKDRPPTSQKQLTNDSDSMRAVNNQEGNKVSCSVTPSGSGFNVKGDGNAYAESDGKVYKPSIVSIRIPAIAPGDTSVKGNLAVQDHASLNTYTSDQCSFSVSGASLGVDAGKIWGSVRCEALSDSSSPGSACLVDTGYFVFENCAK
jgi:hypothetical protein